MRLEAELLCQDIGRFVVEHVLAADIDYNKIVQTNALKALREIKTVVHSDGTMDDFMMVDKIADIFAKYNIDTRGCHDFL